MLSDALMLTIAEEVSRWFELIGISIIVVGAGLSGVRFVLATIGVHRVQDGDRPGDLSAFRKSLGRSILAGLELLVAADIIRTVAVEPTLSNVLVLALIVVIRTFLSFSLEVEIDGRFPWQSREGQR